jgi:hypothetical protein
MPDDRTVKKINWKPIAPRHIGRPKLRWEEDVRNDLRLMMVQSGRNSHKIEINGKG